MANESLSLAVTDSLMGRFYPMFRSAFYGSLRKAQVNELNFLVPRLMSRGLTCGQVAYIMATIMHETNNTFAPVEEAYYVSADPVQADAWRKKNLRYYPWHGRGYVQLTHEHNYRRVGKELGLPLLDKPELALEAEPALDIIVTGMMKGWFGMPLPSYVNEGKRDYYNARRSVNILDDAKLISGYAEKFYFIFAEIYASPAWGTYCVAQAKAQEQEQEQA